MRGHGLPRAISDSTPITVRATLSVGCEHTSGQSASHPARPALIRRNPLMFLARQRGRVPRTLGALSVHNGSTHAFAPSFGAWGVSRKSGGTGLSSVRPKTGDFAVVRCRRRVFSRRILRRVGIFSKKSSPSRAEKAASRDVGGLRATPKRPTSRVGYQNRNRPRLRGHQTSSTASTRFASQTLSFLTLQ